MVKKVLIRKSVSIDVAEAEIIAAFSSAFGGWGAISAWDVTTVCTTAAELQTAITTATGTDNVAVKTKLICDWDGVSTKGSILTCRTTAAPGGLWENGGALYIVANTGRTPAIGDQVNLTGVRGVHWKNIGFAKRAEGGVQDNIRAVLIENTSTRPARVVAMFEACIWGTHYWEPAQPVTEYVKAVTCGGAAAEDVYFKDCVFDGCFDVATGTFRYLRVYNCDFTNTIGDQIDNFGHDAVAWDSDLAYYSYMWVERCTMRASIGVPGVTGLHKDGIQTGTSADGHFGYRALYRKNIIHMDETDSGAGQGYYNDDALTANNQFVFRDSIVCVSAPNCVTWFSPAATRQSYFDRLTLMRCGVVVAGNDSAINVNAYTIGSPPSGVWCVMTNCIRSALVDTGSHVTETGGVICSPRNTSIVTDSAERPEAVFISGASNFVRTAGKLSYTVANETGTRAQFVAGMWALFEPVTAGKGCPDPRSWF